VLASKGWWSATRGNYFRLAMTISHSREDAEEIAQNAFVQAFRNLAKFRGDARFYTWLVRITVNEGLMKMRRRRTNVISIDDTLETQDGTPPYEIADGGLSPEQHYSRRKCSPFSRGQLDNWHRDNGMSCSCATCMAFRRSRRRRHSIFRCPR
jgi:RNA polymerase sigma factor (sigma-70 family)